jgi:Lrp/AsnC family leucine-responsive transcriptional regulator
MSNLKLAATLGLRPAAARLRVKRLTREGYILGYEALLNPAKLGAGMLVLTKVRLEHTGLGLADAFRAAVQVRPEILECHEVAGDFDYLIKTRATDIQTYSSMLASLIWSLPGVRDTRSYAVMEELKNSTRLPL